MYVTTIDWERMDRMRCTIRQHKRWLWGIAAAVCLMQLIPLHLHFHHSEKPDTAGTLHVVDIHTAGSATDQQHHDDAHVIDLSAKTILKSLDGDLFVLLLSICLLTVFLVPSTRRCPSFPEAVDGPPPQLFLIFSPLRAPPRT